MLANKRVQTIAEILADGRRRRVSKDLLTPDLYPEWNEVYEIHDIVDSMLGQKVVGWKVGGADEAVRKSEGLPDAILGRIYENSIYTSPADIESDKFINFRQCEAEIIIEIGADLPAGGPELSASDVESIATAVRPGLEVGDIVFNDWYGSNPFWGCCLDNAGGGVLVLGDRVPFEAITDFSDIAVEILVNQEARKAGHSSRAMGSPLASAAWIINGVRARGIDINSGDILSTGTTTGHCFVEPGDHVELRFSELGNVSAVLN